jgi:NAD(P)-dependent dehydrogenase (short-subunit alcohol dehydrogenase family)
VNLTNTNEITEFCDQHKEYLNDLTLINMAVYSHDSLMASVKPEQVYKTFEVNLFSNIYLVQKLIAIMISENFGRIIHISSVVGQVGNIGAGIYAASKTALTGYNKTLCKEYARFGITSNILSLGYFDGGLINTLPRQEVDKIVKKIPSRRLGASSEVIEAINFLRSCSYINGETINLHGGL